MAIRAPSEPEPWADADILSYEVKSMMVCEIISSREPGYIIEHIKDRMVQELARKASQEHWLLGEPTTSIAPWENVGEGYTRVTMVAPAVQNVRPEHLGMVESSLQMTPSRRTINAVQETWPRTAADVFYDDRGVTQRPRYYEV